MTSQTNVLATPIAPYDGTDDEAIQRTWGSDAVFCTRCVPGMWHHSDYHIAQREAARQRFPEQAKQGSADTGERCYD